MDLVAAEGMVEAAIVSSTKVQVCFILRDWMPVSFLYASPWIRLVHQQFARSAVVREHEAWALGLYLFLYLCFIFVFWGVQQIKICCNGAVLCCCSPCSMMATLQYPCQFIAFKWQVIIREMRLKSSHDVTVTIQNSLQCACQTSMVPQLYPQMKHIIAMGWLQSMHVVPYIARSH